jgi:hypothetical protein
MLWSGWNGLHGAWRFGHFWVERRQAAAIGTIEALYQCTMEFSHESFVSMNNK